MTDLPHCSPTRFLVAGGAVPETVPHHETGCRRYDTGGSAGQMTAALGRHQLNVTLVTTAIACPPGHHSASGLKDSGVDVEIGNDAESAIPGWRFITTKAGEPEHHRGTWACVQNLEELLRRLLPHHDWLLLDCNHAQDNLNAALQMARDLRKPAVLNCTAAQKAERAWQSRHIPKRLVSANEKEFRVLVELAGTDDPRQVRESLSSAYLLVTRGLAGWKLYGRLGDDRRSPALDVPPDSDFVGCGHYATAGLCHAMADDLPIVVNVNNYIRMGLKSNRAGVRPGKGHGRRERRQTRRPQEEASTRS